MNILVTGGAGFIGSNIVDKYLEAGHRVIVADNLSTGHRRNLNPEAIFYETDIRTPELEEIFRKHNIDIVNHLAAQIDIRKSLADPLNDASVNIIGGINLLNMAKKYEIKKLIYSSTGGAMYGEPVYLPADEQHPVRPFAAYGASKHALEHYIELYNDLYSLDYTVFRYANVFGPRQDPLGEAGVIAIFIGKMQEGETPLIFGDGNQTRDFVYIDDVVQANLIALEKGSSEIFNIGTGRETTVNEVYETIRELIPGAPEVKYEPARPGEIYRICLDSSKAKKMLGWEPKTDFREGMKITIDSTVN